MNIFKNSFALISAAALFQSTSFGATPTNDEQYMLALVNRMRANPVSELGILTNITGTTWQSPRSDDSDVAAALAYFNVDAAALVTQWSTLQPAPPLAWNSTLDGTASAHNQAMISADSQSHQLPGENPLGTRITDAGYQWTSAGENIYAYSTSIAYGHAGFAIDWGTTATGIQDPAGHRANLMDATFREVGISIVAESNPATSVGPLVITQDFARNVGDPFLTGVVYSDSVLSDDFYTPGEGIGGIEIDAFEAGTMTLAGFTTSWTSGGYSLQLPNGDYDVRFSANGTNATFSDITISSGNNSGLDFVVPVPEPSSLSLLLGAAFVASLPAIKAVRRRDQRWASQ